MREAAVHHLKVIVDDISDTVESLEKRHVYLTNQYAKTKRAIPDTAFEGLLAKRKREAAEQVADLLTDGRSIRLQISSHADAIESLISDDDAVALFAEAVEMAHAWSIDCSKLIPA